MTRERHDLPQVISQQLDAAKDTTMTTRRGKPWYTSKTIWAQIIGALISILIMVTASPGLEQYAVYISIAINALTIVLRLLTDQPIAGGPKG